MKIVVRRTFANAHTAIDVNSYEGITSPMGLGNSPDEARDDLMRQLDSRRCAAFDCEWPACQCGERGK